MVLTSVNCFFIKSCIPVFKLLEAKSENHRLAPVTSRSLTFYGKCLAKSCKTPCPLYQQRLWSYEMTPSFNWSMPREKYGWRWFTQISFLFQDCLADNTTFSAPTCEKIWTVCKPNAIRYSKMVERFLLVLFENSIIDSRYHAHIIIWGTPLIRHIICSWQKISRPSIRSAWPWTILSLIATPSILYDTFFTTAIVIS